MQVGDHRQLAGKIDEMILTTVETVTAKTAINDAELQVGHRDVIDVRQLPIEPTEFVLPFFDTALPRLHLAESLQHFQRLWAKLLLRINNFQNSTWVMAYQVILLF